MVTVEKKSLNGVPVGIDMHQLENYKKDSSLLFETKNNKLITVSIRKIKELAVDEQVVDFSNLGEFIEKENPLVNDEFYIFPSHNLSLYIDFANKEFLEVLVYDDTLKPMYEKKDYSTYAEQLSTSLDLQPPDSLLFIPYQSIGNYKFGENENELINRHQIKVKPAKGIGGKSIYHLDFFILRFDDMKFTQLTLENSTYKEAVLYTGFNINSKEGIKSLLAHEHIESRSHYIFTALGLSVSKNSDQIELFFFDKYLLKFWQQVNRPITSW